MSMDSFLEDWRAHLSEAVSPLQRGVGPLDVQGSGSMERPGVRPNRTAAVLVPVLDEDEPGVVLTRRAEELARHAGQISFPGGRAEEGDSSAVQTALRETFEEIGLEPDRVTPIGFLDRFDIISDYRVLPVVGLVRTPVQWRLDRREVTEVFTVPLRVVLDRTRYEEEAFQRYGASHTVYSLEWEGHRIWGATAAMLLNLSGRLRHHLQSEIA